MATESGEMSAQLSVARDIHKDTKGEIEKYLVKKNKKIEKVNFIEKIDKNLLGGFVLRYEDKIVDASLQNALLNLKKTLIN